VGVLSSSNIWKKSTGVKDKKKFYALPPIRQAINKGKFNQNNTIKSSGFVNAKN